MQDDADSTPAELDATLDQIAQAGFDTVLYLVGSGVVRYESDLLPRASSVANGFDSLAYVVQAAHARGLKVQAWWCPGIAVQGTEFRHQHPSWDIATVRGIPDNFHWLNFSKPEVRQFVGDVVLEIAQKYEVDGIHLDYIRYPPPPPYSPIDPRKFFGANDVPQTVKDAYSRLKAVKPNVELTAAVLDGQAASANHLQNWAEWLAGGYIDAVMPMAYYGPSEEAELSRRIAEWKALPHAERVVPGLSVAYSLKLGKTNPKSWEQSDAQIGLLRANGFNGYAIFDSQTLTGEILNGLSASR
ncbi:MAG: family 10 glycosylhydrolase [Chloroflexi bacterium]|nr:family 10 glycosylhydrolase [Chloroflexota bacterium]